MRTLALPLIAIANTTAIATAFAVAMCNCNASDHSPYHLQGTGRMKFYGFIDKPPTIFVIRTLVVTKNGASKVSQGDHLGSRGRPKKHTNP